MKSWLRNGCVKSAARQYIIGHKDRHLTALEVKILDAIISDRDARTERRDRVVELITKEIERVLSERQDL
ncbi:hypothetical protein ACFL0S_01055 [Thermodesulfobacteriota bacterium]